MTLELILLMIVSMLILLTFAGANGPPNVFKEAGPRLGARIERNLSTGRGFEVRNQNGSVGVPQFQRPPGGAPGQDFQR